MNTRRMKVSDLPALFTLWEEAGLTIGNKAREQTEVVMMIKLNPTSCFVTLEEGKIIGSIFGVFNGRRAWIYHLAIDPKYQNIGYGSVLLKKTEMALKARKATRILLWMDQFNPKTLPFYRKNGFKFLHDKRKIMKKDL